MMNLTINIGLDHSKQDRCEHDTTIPLVLSQNMYMNISVKRVLAKFSAKKKQTFWSNSEYSETTKYLLY